MVVSKESKANIYGVRNESKFDIFELKVEDADILMGIYSAEVGHLPLLSFEEEQAFGRKIDQGRIASRHLADRELSTETSEHYENLVVEGKIAASELVIANLRLVISVASRYRNRNIKFLDLIQAGNLGLVKAVGNFDYKRNVRFATYATWEIGRQVKNQVLQQEKPFRETDYLHRQLVEYRENWERLCQLNGAIPSFDQVVDRMEKNKVGDREVFSRVLRHHTSLDIPVGRDENQTRIEITKRRDPKDYKGEQSVVVYDALQESLRENLEDVLFELNPREYLIIDMHYGLGNTTHSIRGQSMELSEVAKKLGLSHTWIKTLHVRILNRLRHPSRSRRLKEFY